MKYILGLDFGGTKLAAGIVNPENGEIAESLRIDTPPEKEASASFRAMIGLAKQMAKIAGNSGHEIGQIGVSFDGPVNEDNRTPRFSMHVSGWEGFNLADEVEKELKIKTLVGNDADASALAEYRYGAGKGARNMLYFTVSTGIGGGVIIDGKLYRGEHAWAGEMGHMILKPDGPPCPCGRRGCLESLSSGLSVARTTRERLKQPVPKPKPKGYKISSLQDIPRNKITAKDVANAARSGDIFAQSIWNEAMMWLGIGIASAANIINPGKVVLGGGLTQSGEILFDPVRRVVRLRAMDPLLEVLPAHFRENVGIVGAAALTI